ncbi:hypothetical protein ACIF8T_13115 [Streptomyces sp. NPDC085946]|uniref:hypothetical protein n=1 Tax=Streptomyces sp. NPDC085946 TaxID=3365744 RepID=UPI0037D8C936
MTEKTGDTKPNDFHATGAETTAPASEETETTTQDFHATGGGEATTEDFHATDEKP